MSDGDENGNAKKRKPFNIKGAYGETIAIGGGEYYFNTKARCRRMMQDSLSPEDRRVHACLELHTMGFRQELAVIKEGGKERPLTPSDIARQTGISNQNARRSLVNVENAGLAKRVSDDGGPLRQGHVFIYSWAVPREPKTKTSSQRATTFPDWFPESWEPLKPPP